MVQKLKNIVFFLLFLGSLIIGISIGRLMSVGEADYAANTTQTAGAPQNPVHAVLIAGVNDLAAPQTSLQSAWLAFFEQGSPSFDLLPLYPVNNNPALYKFLGPHAPLQINPQDLSSFKDLDVFQMQNAVWDDVILVDEWGLNQIIYLTTQAPQNGADGTSFAASLTDPWEDPQTALHEQANIYEFLCDQTSTFAEWENAEKALGLLGEHILSTFDERTLMIQWQWLSNQSFEIECKFPPLP